MNQSEGDNVLNSRPGDAIDLEELFEMLNNTGVGYILNKSIELTIIVKEG